MNWLSELLTEPLLPTWLILILALLLMAVPMGPAEPTAVVVGALVTASVVPLVPALLAVAAGMLLGDVLTYRAGGVIAQRVSRHSCHARRLKHWEQQLGAKPLWTAMGAAGLRFVPGARSPAALIARGAGMGGVQFAGLAAGGSLLWAALWVLGGAGLTQVLSPGLLAIIVALALLSLVIVHMIRCLSRSPKFS